jgi:hypothetical protein
MKNLRLVLGILLGVALFWGVTAALAQTSDPVGQLRPTVIDIQQAVPVLAEIDGATVPFTVDVALRVDLSGPVTASVEAVPTPVVEVATATPPPALGGTDIASAQPLDYEEVARYTEDHVGELYSFRAEIYEVRESDTKLYARIEGAGEYGGNAIVWWNPDNLRVLDGDTVDIVAEVTGRIATGYGDKPEFRGLSIELVND